MSNREEHFSRWVLPQTVHPEKYRKFVICVPEERFYIAAFKGLLIELTYSKNWQRDTAKTAAIVARVWQYALESVMCDDCGDLTVIEEMDYQMSICEQLRFQNGKLQGLCCGEWVDIAGQGDLPPGGGDQPGGGTEQPPIGGCATYHAKMNASNQWYLPTIVNTGDTITVSNAVGAGNDGTLAPWHCPPGTTFFAGACIGGTAGPMGGDPDATANHMELVTNIDGTWYRPLAGAITVPGGVVNAPVYFQVNDSNISDNAGSYVFDVEVCNNQTAQFTHIFNLKLTNGGLISDPGSASPGGVWVAGAGWQQAWPGGSSLVHIALSLTFPVVVAFLGATLEFENVVIGNDPAPGVRNGFIDLELSGVSQGVGGTPRLATGDTSRTIALAANGDQLRFAYDLNSNGDNTGTGTATKLTISGYGADPF